MNIRKIAELAGVSVATVSRVFNHPERVMPETRERVLAVTREHNFTPNWFARGLTLGSTKTITLLVPDIAADVNRNIISGIDTVAGNKGFVVILGQTRDDARAEFDFLQLMKNRKVDGAIQIRSQMDAAMAAEAEAFDIPRVHIGKNRECGCDMICYFDYEEAAYRLFRHLASLGHQSSVLLHDRGEDDLALEIEAGLNRAAKDLRKSLFFSTMTGPSGTEGGFSALQRLAEKGELPHVLITMNDLQAIGALRAARDRKIRIPDDLALVSFNDSPVCSVVSPAITSIEMPAAKLGMASARLLFDRIEGEDGESDVMQEMVLQPKLKIRESCGNKTRVFELFD